jgi:uncharacterized membrane protein
MIAAVALGLVVVGVSLALAQALLEARLLAGIPLMLDMWLAASLLRLSQDMAWTQLAAVGAIVLVRKLVLFALNDADPARHSRRELP